MDPRPRSRSRRALTISLALAGAGAASAQNPPQDPFEPGLRWSHAAPADTPWIPRDATFVGDGAFLWTAPAIETPRLQLFASGERPGGEDATPLWQSEVLVGALGSVRVAAGDEPTELFAAAQYPAPTASSRRTLVTRHDAEEAARSGSFLPAWTYDFGTLCNGPARVASSADGETIVAAQLDAPRGQIHVARLDPEDGHAVWRRTLAGTALRALLVAGSGDRVALAAGSTLYVLDAAGSPELTLPEPSATEALGLSADGTWLVHGRTGGVDVRHDSGFGYQLAASRGSGPGEVLTGAAISDDGATFALVAWNSIDGVSVRLEVVDRVSGTLENQVAQVGPGPGALQNFPVAIALTGDGERIALGLWGAGDGRPEALLLERGNPVPLFALDLSGSVQAIALSTDGTRLGVCAKDTHANLFGTTGTVSLFDTGERDLQLVAPVRPGGALELELLLPEPGTAVFAFGFERALPAPSPWGPLWVDFAGTHFFRSAPGATGRATFSLPLGPGPGLVGLRFAVQAVSVGPTGVELAGRTLRPRVL